MCVCVWVHVPAAWAREGNIHSLKSTHANATLARRAAVILLEKSEVQNHFNDSLMPNWH